MELWIVPCSCIMPHVSRSWIMVVNHGYESWIIAANWYMICWTSSMQFGSGQELQQTEGLQLRAVKNSVGRKNGWIHAYNLYKVVFNFVWRENTHHAHLPKRIRLAKRTEPKQTWPGETIRSKPFIGSFLGITAVHFAGKSELFASRFHPRWAKLGKAKPGRGNPGPATGHNPQAFPGFKTCTWSK